jgi:hypothetical protein
MAEDLAMSGVDLADDRSCILTLLTCFGYRGLHIDLGLDAVQNLARALRQQWLPAIPEAA